MYPQSRLESEEKLKQFTSNCVSMIYLATSVELENLGISMHQDNLSIPLNFKPRSCKIRAHVKTLTNEHFSKLRESTESILNHL